MFLNIRITSFCPVVLDKYSILQLCGSVALRRRWYRRVGVEALAYHQLIWILSPAVSPPSDNAVLFYALVLKISPLAGTNLLIKPQ
jgi:hypothetical protein